jgi:hypothetical protein
LLGSEESGQAGQSGTSGEKKELSLEDLTPSLIKQLKRLLKVKTEE